MDIGGILKAEVHIPFILGGKAFISVYSKRKDLTINFRIRKHEKKNIWFVSVEYSSQKYAYLGMITEHLSFIHTKFSKLAEFSVAFASFSWLWQHLISGALPDFMEINHRSRCGRCGYKLKTKKSVELGFGPYCWRKTDEETKELLAHLK